MTLDGQVAIVTGASRGIGKGLALGLAAEGATVVCAARTIDPSPEGLPGTIRETYAVAKAAMERFSTALAPELADDGIAVNALRPGAVKTEVATLELGPDHDWSGWATPDAVVPAVVYLARQRADGLTGQVVDSTQYGTDWP